MRIEVRNVSKSFEDGRPVLDNISFADDITSLAVIGPSGGGKSTLLRILGGLLSKDTGEILVDGDAVTGSEKELIAYRRKIGFVFQKSGLFYHLTGRENIILPLVKVHGFTQAEAEKRADELLSRFGLTEDADKRPAALSGGQQQRIAIARAVAPDPKLLLLDEPTSALDPEYTIEVLNMIEDLKKSGIRFIIVTHEMGFARNACDKAAFLYGGRLLEYGESRSMFSEPATPELKRFLGRLLEWQM